MISFFLDFSIFFLFFVFDLSLLLPFPPFLLLPFLLLLISAEPFLKAQLRKAQCTKPQGKQGFGDNRLPPPSQQPWALLESPGLHSHGSRPSCLPPMRKLQTRDAETLLQVSPKLLSRGEVGLKSSLTSELSSPHVVAIYFFKSSVFPAGRYSTWRAEAASGLFPPVLSVPGSEPRSWEVLTSVLPSR